jgi:hypothetical protein
MTQEDYRHPIAPPPELVQQWIDAPHDIGLGCHRARSVPVETYAKRLIEAAQWGADMELEACCEWLASLPNNWTSTALKRVSDLRTARRSKPPSLKEQALTRTAAILNDPNRALLVEERETLELALRALEQLDD